MRPVAILSGHGGACVQPHLGREGPVVELGVVDGRGSLGVIGETHGRISLLELGG
jgi:hypothetical protein